MTSRAIILRRTLLAIVVALVLARSVAPLSWGDPHFNADHATFGLMAKHIAEGRAFPVLQYGTQYVLVLEAWMSAPLMIVSDHSPALLSVVPVALNVLSAALLFVLVSRDASPWLALLATLPIALPSVSAGDELTEPLGMNIEPLFFALLLWLLRDRPIALGTVAAIGVKNREFVLYAMAALLLVELLRTRSLEFWRSRVHAAVAFGITWTVLGILTYLSSPFGPGTAMGHRAAANNMAQAAAAVCISPPQIPADVASVVTELLPFQYGFRTIDWRMGGYPGSPPADATIFWWPFVALVGAGAARGLWRAWRAGPSAMTWLGAFLVVTGAQSVVVYAVTQCGRVGLGNLRYMLLSLFIAAGAIVLALERERSSAIRAAASTIVLAWVGWCAFGHFTLFRTYQAAPPERSYARLARYLEDHGIRYIRSDYWTGYHVAFLTSERVRSWSFFNRVRDHALAVDAHLDEAVEVKPVIEGPCENALRVEGFYLCAGAGRPIERGGK